MNHSRIRPFIRAALLLCATAGSAIAGGMSVAGGADGAALPQATQDLMNRYPGVQAMLFDGRVTALFGKPMSGGQAPDEAVGRFWSEHADAFGVNMPELELTAVNDLEWGKFTCYSYEQRVGGVPVEFGTVRVLVLNRAPDGMSHVVYAAAKLADTAVDLQPDALTGEQARNLLIGAYPAYTDWSAPETIIYFGEGDGPHWRDPIRAFRVVGDNRQEANRLRKVFIVDAATGQLVHERDGLSYTDVTGNVSGKATPGVKPDTVSNPATTQPLWLIRAQVTGGNNAYTNSLGNFTITNPGTSAVTVTTTLDNGQWVNVNTSSGSVLSGSVGVTPPGPANFVLNNSPTAANTAQVNAFIGTTATHEYFKSRAPSYTGLDIAIPANTNIASTCNAFFDGSSINFYSAGGGCVNTAYSTVISHEYGHFIVSTRGLAQGSFGEGYGDTVAMLLWNTPIVGEDFQGTGNHVRNPDQDNVPYPCGGEIHFCGETLAGVWYEIKKEYELVYGSAAGLEKVRQQQVSWSVVTNGGSGNDSAHPQTAVEVLTIDDNDGDLANGTPNYSLICPQFAEHNISCPAVSLLGFTFPNGLPTQVTPGQPKTIPVNVTSIGGTAQPGTGQVTYRFDNGSFTTVNMTQGLPNQYTATLPAAPCGTLIGYYFSAKTTTNVTVTSPSNAPTTTHSAVAAYGSPVTVFTDDFETNKAWSTVGAGDNATTGIWTRVNPVGTAAQPEDDHTAGAGTQCFVTGQGAVGGGLGDNDVDGGQTTLTSPVLNLAGAVAPVISYWRWYSNNQGADPNNDVFVVDISNNNGSSWTRVETVGPTGSQAGGGWFFKSFNVKDFVTPTATVKVRFIASDLNAGSIVEAAVDDFLVTRFDCSCPGDFNGDTSVDDFDFFDFLNAFNAQQGSADFNGDTSIDDFDFFDFLNAFNGC
ncbi:MAG: hypothetical protein JNM07_00130 [Phycisphaerae bacterium]|nr:hypothetical protein [Phycisphaerae bacterium]